MRRNAAFSIRIENVTGKKVYFVIKDQEGNKTVYQIGTTPISKFVGKLGTYSKKAAVYYRAHGAVPMAKKCIERLRTPKAEGWMYEDLAERKIKLPVRS